LAAGVAGARPAVGQRFLVLVGGGRLVAPPLDEQPLARLFVGQHLVIEMSGGNDVVHVPDFQRRQRLQGDADAGRVLFGY
jgi:hypothetical protein